MNFNLPGLVPPRRQVPEPGRRGMRPGPGEVLHFSEDPGITRFVPHVAATAQQPEAYVWAVNAARAPDYWFRLRNAAPRPAT